MTRDDAIEKLKSVYYGHDLDLEFDFISKKLGITSEELHRLKKEKQISQ